MTKLVKPENIHSAADSWSGFIYQGKIALYHVLRLLVEDLANSSALQLQLDSLEDFAIVDANISPISLHQVKAMKSNLYSTYKEPFEKLEQRKVDFPPLNGAFFHLAVQNEKTNTQIKADHPTIDIYVYRNTNSYCGLDEIDSCIELLISDYLNANGLTHLNNPSYLTITRNSLEDLIVSQIIAIHANNHQRNGLQINEGAYHFVIPFANFIDILNTNLNFKITDESYFLSLTKKQINVYFTEFITDIEEEYKEDGREADLTTALKLKIDGYLQQINNLNNKELVEFIKNIIPHRSFKLKTILDFKDNNVDKDGFILAFLQSLFELKQSNGSIKDDFTWSCAAPMLYSPSLINLPHTQQRVICKQIFDNIMNNDVKTPFNSENIITSVINVDSIIDELNNTQRTELQNNKNHITKWGTVSLISLDRAKRKNYMIDLLKQIFSPEKFYQSEFSNGLFFKPIKGTNNANYWLVVKSDALSNIIEIQDIWFDEIKKIYKEPGIDKNTSLLLLHELSDELNTVEKEIILKIEEDPYQFKKHVLCYKVSEVTELNRIIKDSNQDTLGFIEKNIIDKEIFNVYKKNPKSYNWQSLLFRLSLKLPLIQINVLKDDGLVSLFATNEDKIAQNGFNKLNDLINKHFSSTSNEDIQELIDAETILAILTNIDQSDEDNSK